MNRRHLASAGAAIVLIAFAGVAIAQERLLRLNPTDIAALTQGGATAGASGVSVYISGYGPTSTDYVEAANAPKP